MDEKLKTKAKLLRPAQAIPLRSQPRSDGAPTRQLSPTLPTGQPVWHGVTGNRPAFPLPAEAKGPIRSREARRAKGQPGY